MVKENRWQSGSDLINCLRNVCSYIDDLKLVETAAANMTRRIMRIIRDECQNFHQNQNSSQHKSSVCSQTGPSQSSLSQMEFESTSDSTAADGGNLNLDIYSTGIIDNILEGIEQELMNELELSSRSIAQLAVDYVQSDDVILTLGKSKIIETFLKHAAIGGKTGKRKFNVIVVELAPFYSGREMAKSLMKSGISTLIIPDSAIFAIMSRVNKVIIGTHSMMANGGIKAPAGSHSVALAAKHFSVPLIVCCPMYKLTPEYLVSHDSEAFRQFSNLHAAFPEPYISKAAASSLEAAATATAAAQQATGVVTGATAAAAVGPATAATTTGSLASVESLHSIFDYVPPELIALFVSNIGGYSPSYVYQLLNELYCKSDYLD